MHSILYDPNQGERETLEDGYSFANADPVRAHAQGGGGMPRLTSRNGRVHCGSCPRSVPGSSSTCIPGSDRPPLVCSLSPQAEYVLGEFVDVKTMPGSRRVAERPSEAPVPGPAAALAASAAVASGGAQGFGRILNCVGVGLTAVCVTSVMQEV